MNYGLIFALSWVLSVVGFTWFAIIRDTDDLTPGSYATNVILSFICFFLCVFIFVKAMAHEYKLGLEKGRQIWQIECGVLK